MKQKHLLAASAVRVVAGPGREDRMVAGSYRTLRSEEGGRKEEVRGSPKDERPGGDGYLPDFLK